MKRAQTYFPALRFSTLGLLIAGCALVWVLGSSTLARAAAPENLVQAAHRQTAPPRGTPARRAWAVCRYFKGAKCRPALAIAWCESGLRPWAANGRYRGVFQMGSHERATYGHGRSVWAQAQAARRLYNARGWQPWTCRPW